MKQFKKRTIALVLASVITVAGAVGAENFKNSLMSLKFESGSNGAVDVVFQTRRDYSSSINPVKKDSNTYVIMLPEINSKLTSKPETSGDIESVDVKTMPYTSSSKGYTKVTIKTGANTVLNAKKSIYVPDNEPAQPQTEYNEPRQERETVSYQEPVRYPTSSQPRPNSSYYPNYNRPNTIHSASGVDQTRPVDIRQSVKQFEPSSTSAKPDNTSENQQTVQKKPATPPVVEESNASETLLLVSAIFLVLILVVFFYIKAKNKMVEVLGAQEEFVIDDDPPKKKKDTNKEKSKKIKNTIKQLDKMYSKPAVQMNIKPVSASVPELTVPDEDENNVIVDLDELFQDKVFQDSEPEKTEDEENDALDDFLNAFSFDMGEESDADQSEEEHAFDENLYEKFINDDSLQFSKEDVQRIDALLNSEINDDTLKNIDQFLPAEPVEEKKPTQTEILEDLVTSYVVNQNITFTNEDIQALFKLISVEIDNDFITDLRTNPERRAEMQREFEKRNENPHKSSELLTLNVKDMLPDLSEALKKQGGKKIESEVKPQVVYFSEGYEVSKLSLDQDLPNLSVEVNNKDAYKHRSSDEIQYVETGYDVDKMSISNEFGDLADMLKNPEKYETKKEKPVEVDADSLLSSISNVTFKPFYDGSEQFEVVNDLPSMEDMQQEFNQLGKDFEIMQDEETYVPEMTNDSNDFESLYDNNYFDLDKASDLNDWKTNAEETDVVQSADLDSEFDEFFKDTVPASSEAESVIKIDLDSSDETEPVAEQNLEPEQNLELDLEKISLDFEKNQTEPDVSEPLQETTEDSVVAESFVENSVDDPVEDSILEPKIELDLQEEVVPEINLLPDETISVNNTDTVEPIRPKRSRRSIVRSDKNAEKLLKLIEEQKEERSLKEVDSKNNNDVIIKTTEPAAVETPSKFETVKTCSIDGEMFEVLARAKFADRIGCYLAKNDNGYTIIGYTGCKMFKIKSYEKLNAENIQSRVSEKLNDGTLRYIVRIGIHKFILNVSDDSLEYVMDLC